MRIVRKRKNPTALPISVRGCSVATFGEISGGIAACRTGASSVIFVAENSIEKRELEEISCCFKNASVSSSLCTPVDVALLARPVSNAAYCVVKQSTHIVVSSAAVAVDAFLAEGFLIEQRDETKPTVLTKSKVSDRPMKRRKGIVPGSLAYNDAVVIGLGTMELGPKIEEVDST